MRPLIGFLVGAALGAALTLVHDPVIVLMGDFYGWRIIPALLFALLSWAAAFGIGLLAARLSGRFEIPAATLSVLVGAAIVQSIGDPNLPLLDWHVVFYGGLYPVFAFFGGAVAYARRQGRRRVGQSTSS